MPFCLKMHKMGNSVIYIFTSLNFVFDSFGMANSIYFLNKAYACKLEMRKVRVLEIYSASLICKYRWLCVLKSNHEKYQVLVPCEGTHCPHDGILLPTFPIDAQWSFLPLAVIILP